MLTKELSWSRNAYRDADSKDDPAIIEILYNAPIIKNKRTGIEYANARLFGFKRLALCISRAPGVFMDADLRKARNIFVNMRSQPITMLAKHIDKVLLQRVIAAQKARKGTSDNVQ